MPVDWRQSWMENEEQAEVVHLRSNSYKNNQTKLGHRSFSVSKETESKMVQAGGVSGESYILKYFKENRQYTLKPLNSWFCSP